MLRKGRPTGADRTERCRPRHKTKVLTSKPFTPVTVPTSIPSANTLIPAVKYRPCSVIVTAPCVGQPDVAANKQVSSNAKQRATELDSKNGGGREHWEPHATNRRNGTVADLGGASPESADRGDNGEAANHNKLQY